MRTAACLQDHPRHTAQSRPLSALFALKRRLAAKPVKFRARPAVREDVRHLSKASSGRESPFDGPPTAVLTRACELAGFSFDAGALRRNSGSHVTHRDCPINGRARLRPMFVLHFETPSRESYRDAKQACWTKPWRVWERRFFTPTRATPRAPRALRALRAPARPRPAAGPGWLRGVGHGRPRNIRARLRLIVRTPGNLGGDRYAICRTAPASALYWRFLKRGPEDLERSEKDRGPGRARRAQRRELRGSKWGNSLAPWRLGCRGCG